MAGVRGTSSGRPRPLLSGLSFLATKTFNAMRLGRRELIDHETAGLSSIQTDIGRAHGWKHHSA